MNRCNTKYSDIKHDLKYDPRKIGYCIPLHNPKVSQYIVIPLRVDDIYKYTELLFIPDIHEVNYPSITRRCYMKRKKNKNGILILHIINKM
jgi:hypothetical protein